MGRYFEVYKYHASYHTYTLNHFSIHSWYSHYINSPVISGWHSTTRNSPSFLPSCLPGFMNSYSVGLNLLLLLLLLSPLSLSLSLVSLILMFKISWIGVQNILNWLKWLSTCKLTSTYFLCVSIVLWTFPLLIA